MANGYKTPGAADQANEQIKKAGPFFIDATDPAWANHALCNAAKREYVFCWAGWEAETRTILAFGSAVRQRAVLAPEACIASILTGHITPSRCGNGCMDICPARLLTSRKTNIRTQRPPLAQSATKTRIGGWKMRLDLGRTIASERRNKFAFLTFYT